MTILNPHLNMPGPGDGDLTDPSVWTPRPYRQVPSVQGLDVARTMNLLMTLAILGEAPYSVLHRMCFFRDIPEGRVYTPYRRSKRVVERILPKLARAGLIASERWYTQSRFGAPDRREDLWALTPKGHALLESLPQYPRTLRKRSHERIREHDQVTVQFLIHMVEMGRLLPLDIALSGVFVAHEYRLDPPKLRPRADALIILRFSGMLTRPDLIPWTRYKPTRDEVFSLRLLLETDRDSEPLSVVAQKARTYRSTLTDRWMRRYGYFPFPIWIVPNERRLRQVNRVWAEHWPRGGWMITTDEWMEQDDWIEYFEGEWQERKLFNARRIQEVVHAARETNTMIV